MDEIQKLNQILDKCPIGLIGSFNGYDLFKYEANEDNIESQYHLDLKLGEIWYNTDAVTPFKDLETFLNPYNVIQINLNILLR